MKSTKRSMKLTSLSADKLKESTGGIVYQRGYTWECDNCGASWWSSPNHEWTYCKQCGAS